MQRKGFSLVELIVVIAVAGAVFAVVVTTYIITERLWKGGWTQVTFQSRGRVVIARISEALRSATQSTILDNGDRIRFVTDPNRTAETLTDDITQEYYVSGLQLIYDPDIAVSGNEVSLLTKVYKESAIQFFQLSGDLAVVTFRLYNSDVIYGSQWSGMTVSIKMRNA